MWNVKISLCLHGDTVVQAAAPHSSNLLSYTHRAALTGWAAAGLERHRGGHDLAGRRVVCLVVWLLQELFKSDVWNQLLLAHRQSQQQQFVNQLWIRDAFRPPHHSSVYSLWKQICKTNTSVDWVLPTNSKVKFIGVKHFSHKKIPLIIMVLIIIKQKKTWHCSSKMKISNQKLWSRLKLWCSSF